MGEVENERVKLISKLSSLVDNIEKINTEITALTESREYLREEYSKTIRELANVSVLK
jgi:chromosome segregation ATPase